MPADNLEIFKKIIFRLPALRTTQKLMIAAGLIYGVVLFGLFTYRFELMLNEVLIPLIGLLLYVLPGVVSSEAYSLLLPEYPRKWGYFLSLVNQLVIFLFTVLVSISSSFPEAWNIIWLGLTTLYASNFFILVLSNGPEVMLSLIHI